MEITLKDQTNYIEDVIQVYNVHITKDRRGIFLENSRRPFSSLCRRTRAFEIRNEEGKCVQKAPIHFCSSAWIFHVMILSLLVAVCIHFPLSLFNSLLLFCLLHHVRILSFLVAVCILSRHIQFSRLHSLSLSNSLSLFCWIFFLMVLTLQSVFYSFIHLPS